MATHYTYNDVEPKEIRARIGNIVDTIRSDQVRDNASRLFNERITSLITFAKKREITDADFARLKPKSIMQKLQSSDNSITHDGKIYEVGSLPERRVLLRFLTNNTFKEVKTHSLRVPYKDSYILPDFQCLTHLNHLVIVDVKPLLNMCKYENIEKFTALREYCQKYGFGYLIIDDRGNSFESIDEENAVFTREILAEIKKHGNVSYDVYREIYDRSGASIKSLLTLIKRHNLKFSLPFTIHE